MKFQEEMDLKSVLWGLSNLNLTKEYSIAFFEQEGLADRVMALCASENIGIKTEASLAVAIAVVSCGDNNLPGVWERCDQERLTEIILSVFK